MVLKKCYVFIRGLLCPKKNCIDSPEFDSQFIKKKKGKRTCMSHICLKCGISQSLKYSLLLYSIFTLNNSI